MNFNFLKVKRAKKLAEAERIKKLKDFQNNLCQNHPEVYRKYLRKMTEVYDQNWVIWH